MPSLVYPDSEIDANGSCDRDEMKNVLGGSVMNRLGNSIFRRHDVSLDLKLRLFNSCVVPIFTYGSESWSLIKHRENRHDACQPVNIAGSEELYGFRKTESQTPVEANLKKIKRTTKRKMDGLY